MRPKAQAVVDRAKKKEKKEKIVIILEDMFHDNSKGWDAYRFEVASLKDIPWIVFPSYLEHALGSIKYIVPIDRGDLVAQFCREANCNIDIDAHVNRDLILMNAFEHYVNDLFEDEKIDITVKDDNDEIVVIDMEEDETVIIDIKKEGIFKLPMGISYIPNEAIDPFTGAPWGMTKNEQHKLASKRQANYAKKFNEFNERYRRTQRIPEWECEDIMTDVDENYYDIACDNTDRNPFLEKAEEWIEDDQAEKDNVSSPVRAWRNFVYRFKKALPHKVIYSNIAMGKDVGDLYDP